MRNPDNENGLGITLFLKSFIFPTGEIWNPEPGSGWNIAMCLKLCFSHLCGMRNPDHGIGLGVTLFLKSWFISYRWNLKSGSWNWLGYHMMVEIIYFHICEKYGIHIMHLLWISHHFWNPTFVRIDEIWASDPDIDSDVTVYLKRSMFRISEIWSPDPQTD